MNNSNKFTPGPWTVLSEASKTYIVNENQDTVGIIPSDKDGTEFSDARLISAAPEMFSSLYTAKRVLKTLGTRSLNADDAADIDEAMRIINEAIAKATGGES